MSTSASPSSASNYYDGQGFIGPTSLGVSSATELDGASICIQTGTTTELNLADFFRYERHHLRAGAAGDQR